MTEAVTTTTRRNSFQEVFGAGAKPPAAPAKTITTPPVEFREQLPQFEAILETAKLPSKTETHAPPTATPAAVEGPTVDTSWFRPSTPVSLQALEDALRRAGLDPTKFQFEQVEADGEFPGRPDLSYTTRQIVIRGPNGAGMFDRDLVLRSPWVTAVELRTYGIA